MVLISIILNYTNSNNLLEKSIIIGALDVYIGTKIFKKKIQPWLESVEDYFST